MTETSSSSNISTKIERIAKLARQSPTMVLTTLAHHIDEEWLHEAYGRTRKDGVRGIDGQSGQEYATGLEQRLQSLLERAKSGRYQAPPVKRAYIPKGNGETRPLGIATFEDKVLQRAIAMVLEAIYEQDFLDCSYGFRPGRSAHQGLDALHDAATRIAGGWVVELDIRKYFDTIDHEKLVGILRQRVRDGVILRLIGKWLNAGVMEDGSLRLVHAFDSPGRRIRCRRVARELGRRGIGLAAVAHTVRQLGGTISVESSTVSGTLWRLNIPRTAEDACMLPS